MMENNIDTILQNNLFNPIDRYRADFLYRKIKEKKFSFYMTIMLLSNYIQNGHSCISLRNISGKSIGSLMGHTGSNGDDFDYIFPSHETLVSLFSVRAGDDSSISSNPIILNDDNLYFSKHRFYELEILKNIQKRSGEKAGISESTENLFFSLFPNSMEQIDNQAIAAYMALRKNFSVISGGPGTGKTSTVVKIISLLINEYLESGHVPQLALTAPTGKAAARMMESVESALEKMDLPDRIVESIPDNAHTIHRLLGRRGGSSEFIHNREKRLNNNIIIIDESSMVDLALMARLLSALADDAKIILLGDRDQLASVEGGAVFGDICDRGMEHGLSSELLDELDLFFNLNNSMTIPIEDKDSIMQDSLTVLNKSYRFSDDSFIKVISKNIRKGDSADVLNLLHSGSENLRYISHKEIEDIILGKICECRKAYDENVKSELFIQDYLSRFMVISALRRGRWGVEGLNFLSEQILDREEIIRCDSPFYSGRPVMITGNNYSLGLFNGDRGVVGTYNDEKYVFFPEGAKIPVSRIPKHMTSFAMTIHKSQGSEFDDVMIVLPENYNPLLTRELIYTAITRAKKNIIIVGTDEVIERMVNTPTVRQTGLADELWR